MFFLRFARRWYVPLLFSESGEKEGLMRFHAQYQISVRITPASRISLSYFGIVTPFDRTLFVALRAVIEVFRLPLESGYVSWIASRMSFGF